MKNIATTNFNSDLKTIVPDGHMIAYSGQVINLMNPHGENIRLADIGRGLAFNSRWNGHTYTYFSIAEHCCMMHDRVPKRLKATALFHDCEEAYWGDMIKPLKNIMPDHVRKSMRFMRHLIFSKYGIPEITEEIDKHDFQLLLWDFENLIKNDWHVGWEPRQAEVEWQQRVINLNISEK